MLDNLSTGKRENLKDVIDDVELLEGDIRDDATVHRAVAGVSHVIHLAALPEVEGSVADPATSHEVNLSGTVGLLLAARDEGVESLVFASTCAVYGDEAGMPVSEGAMPRPLSPYAVQKLSCEHYCRVFFELYGLSTYCLRYFNVYGPRQNPASRYGAVIPAFINAIMAGRPTTIFGDGEQTRDFVFVDDVVAANLACRGTGAAGSVLNVASGSETSVNSLARLISEAMASNLVPVHAESRAGEVRRSVGSPDEAASRLDWHAGTTLADGIARTVEFFTESE